MHKKRKNIYAVYKKILVINHIYAALFRRRIYEAEYRSYFLTAIPKLLSSAIAKMTRIIPTDETTPGIS